MLDGSKVIVVIVGFRNPDDIICCLTALSRLNREPRFSVFICENGGASAYDTLLTALEQAPMASAQKPQAVAPISNAFNRTHRMECGRVPVHVAEATENLGYAGGINAWVRPLMEIGGWEGLWVLNPDTEAEPQALAALISYAQKHRKGMVGSRIMFHDNPDIVASRGLRWRRLMASTLGVDLGASVLPPPNPADIEERIDSPSGASVYVTRDCLERIGLMDERYFLYFEDLDWGLRAKSSCGVGYAYDSVVSHVGGSSIGSARRRADRSELAVYLDFRNRLLFVREHYRFWLPWTVAMIAVRATEFLFVGAGANFRAAGRGILAGLRGETGRPDHIFVTL